MCFASRYKTSFLFFICSPSVSLSFSCCTYFSFLDRTWRPLWEEFLDQGKRGQIWKQWALCQTHLDLLLTDKEWVCCLCIFTMCCYHLCFTVMNNVFLRFSPLSPWLHVPFNPLVLPPSASKGKNVTHTHIHLILFSQVFSSLSHPSLPPFGGHTAHLHYSATLCQNSISHKFMNKPPTPVSAYGFIFSMCPWLVVQRSHYQIRWIGTWGQRERWTKGGVLREV